MLLDRKWCASPESCYRIFCMYFYMHVYEMCVCICYNSLPDAGEMKMFFEVHVLLSTNTWRRQDWEIGTLCPARWWAVVYEITTGHKRQVCFVFFTCDEEIILHMFIYLITGKMTEQRWQSYSRCLSVTVVMRNLCTHVHLLNVVERMCLDVVLFQDM